MTTPTELLGVERGTWFEYEALRRSGIMNMRGSQKVLALSKSEFSAIMQHYKEMRDAWLEAFEPPATAMTFFSMEEG